MKKEIREAMKNALGGWQLILELPCFKQEEARVYTLGGNVEHPAFRSTISGWKLQQLQNSSFSMFFFHRVVFNSWKQNHLKLSLIIQCAEILVGVLEHQGHPFIEFL